MTKTVVLFLAMLFVTSLTIAQVAINGDGTEAAASSMLHVQSTDKGMLIPRMTTPQRMAISSPATGLLVFDTTTGGFWFYTGSAWSDLSSGIPNKLQDADGNTKIQVEESANEDKIRFDMAGTEYFVMDKGNLQVNNNGKNIYMGESAGPSAVQGTNYNNFIGYLSGSANTSGFDNTAVGANTLTANTTGSSNTSLGRAALKSNTTGNSNTATGLNALTLNTTGSSNVAYGYYSLKSNLTGSFNTALGRGTLLANTSGTHNTAVGFTSLASNTTGGYNTAMGYQTLTLNTTGANNTAVGRDAAAQNSTAVSNVAIGVSALYNNTTKSHLVAIGDSALYHNTTGIENTAIGSKALLFNTTGSINTSIGYESLYSNTTGNWNTANGFQSLYSNTDGYQNTANGFRSLYYNTTGNSNTANGNRSLYSNTDGYQNTANGTSSLLQNTTGYLNSAYGYSSLRANTTGTENTAMGTNSLYNNTDGYNNTALGYQAFYNGSSFVNSTALGAYTNISASNQARIGHSSVTSIGGYANWTNVSDGRFKTDVKENVAGLDFIMKLRPVTYRLDMDAIAGFTKTPDSLRLKNSEQLKAAEIQIGFIAQEVEAAANSLNFDFHGVDKPKNDNSHYGLRYAEFVVPLVKAVQELSSKNAELEEENLLLKKMNTEIIQRLEKLEKKF